MRQEEPGLGGPLGPLPHCSKPVRGGRGERPAGVGGPAGSTGCTTQRLPRNSTRPPLPHHRLVLFARPPEALALLYAKFFSERDLGYVASVGVKLVVLYLMIVVGVKQ